MDKSTGKESSAQKNDYYANAKKKNPKEKAEIEKIILAFLQRLKEMRTSCIKYGQKIRKRPAQNLAIFVRLLEAVWRNFSVHTFRYRLPWLPLKIEKPR